MLYFVRNFPIYFVSIEYWNEIKKQMPETEEGVGVNAHYM